MNILALLQFLRALAQYVPLDEVLALAKVLFPLPAVDADVPTWLDRVWPEARPLVVRAIQLATPDQALVMTFPPMTATEFAAAHGVPLAQAEAIVGRIGDGSIIRAISEFITAHPELIAILIRLLGV